MSEHSFIAQYGNITVIYKIDEPKWDKSVKYFGLDPIQEVEYIMKLETMYHLAKELNFAVLHNETYEWIMKEIEHE